jgi:RNA polymerase sigma-70 factor (ECF subfamily)
MAHQPETCKEVFELLSEYLNLELQPETCREIERHLEGCSPCVEFLESLRKTVALCRGYEPATKPSVITEEARAELGTAWRKMLASRGRDFA